jgi:hypothetical protein
VQLTAIVSGRTLRLDSPGVVVVLICFAQETQSGIGAVEAAVLRRYPDAAAVLIVHVIDLHKVPGPFRKVAEGILDSEHRKAVAVLRPNQPPDDYVVMVPDWDGGVVKALGLEDVSKAMAVVVIDAAGGIVGSHDGDEPVKATLALLEAL